MLKFWILNKSIKNLIDIQIIDHILAYICTTSIKESCTLSNHNQLLGFISFRVWVLYQVEFS